MRNRTAASEYALLAGLVIAAVIAALLWGDTALATLQGVASAP